MKVLWKAAAAAILLLFLTLIEIGCGDTYRPVITPEPSSTANPSGPETEVVVSCCLSPSSINSASPNPSSVLTQINVSGDSNTGNKVLNNVVGQVTPDFPAQPPAPAPPPFAFDGTRQYVYTANTTTDSVTVTTTSNSSGSVSSTSNTINLEQGSAPISIAFEYFGLNFVQDWVVNSGKTATCPNGGSVTAIGQNSLLVKGTVCLDVPAANPAAQTHASPVLVWPFVDLSKIFVLDNVNDKIYVVSQSHYKVTNTIAMLSGSHPTRVAEDTTGRYLYILNAGTNNITILDAVAEQVLATVTPSGSGGLIDVQQNSDPIDGPTVNDEESHVWALTADGTVTVFQNTSPGSLVYLTSLDTITTDQAKAGAKATNMAMLRDGTNVFVGISNTDQVIAIDPSKLSHSGVTPGVNEGGAATKAITVGVHRNITGSLSYQYTDTATSSTSPTFTGSNLALEVTTPTVTAVAVSRSGSSADQSKAYALTTTSTIYNCYALGWVAVVSGNPPVTTQVPTVVPGDCSGADFFASGTTAVDAGSPNPTSTVSGTAPSNSPSFEIPGICPAGGAPAGTIGTACYQPYLVSNCTDLGLNAKTGQYTMSCPNLYAGSSVITGAALGEVTINNVVVSPGTPINTYIDTIPAPQVTSYCVPGVQGNGSYDAQKNCPLMTPVAILGRN